MARPLRIEFPGAYYHIVQRGTERKNIFISDKDREKFLSYFNSAHLTYKAIFHTYTLMNNHYHLILETPQANLSKIMHYLNASYAVYFNTKRKRTGPLYQGRFKAILVEEDEYLHYLSCYIHLNPVRAGIVKTPEEYLYSSYKYFVSNQKPPQWLNTAFILSMFNRQESKAKKLYKQFVIDNIGKEKDTIIKNMKMGIILGNDDFFQRMKDKLINKKEDSEIPALKELKHTKEPTIEHIQAIVARHIPDNKRLRRSFSIYLTRKYTQKTLREIAESYGKIKYTGVSLVYKRIEERKEKDEGLRRLLAKIEEEVTNCKM